MHRKDLTLPYFLSSTLIFYQTQSRSKQPAPLITNVLHFMHHLYFCIKGEMDSGNKGICLEVVDIHKTTATKTNDTHVFLCVKH